MDILNSFNKEKTSYHTITTKHPYLSDMGLSQFTTGVLYEWWNKKKDGEFSNRKLVINLAPSGVTGAGSPSPEDLLISYSPNFSAANNLTFKSWRKEGKGGKYKYFAIPWQDVNYHTNDRSATDLLFDLEESCKDIEPWKINVEIDAGTYGIAPAEDYTFQSLKLERYDDIAIDPNTGKSTPISGVYPITNIVAMNDDYVYQGQDINYVQGYYSPRSYFLNDIKSSKYGYLYFVQSVPFNINMADGNFACVKKDVVEYQLRLFDYQAPKKAGKTVSFPGIVLSTDAVMPHGQVALNQEDGDGDLPLEEASPASKVAGELDVTYKPATGKFTSGTEQILAVISQQVPAADYTPNASGLVNMNIAEVLDDPLSDSFIGIGSGLAIPINIQNGNPLQWTPSYKKPRGIRKEDLSKIEVLVFNPTPRDFAVDELVFLNKIDGVWVPLPIASGQAGEVTPVAGTITDWEFTYHMTNGVYFFRGGAIEGGSKVEPNQEGRGEFKKIKPTEMEEYFHQRYYKDDALNKESDSSYKGDLAFTNDGYFQVSSFDFMGPEVGGLREKDALKSTIWNTSTDGTQVESPGDGRAQDSAPFFGCVFPEGYKSSKIGVYKQENSTFSAIPTGSLRMDLNEPSQYMKKSDGLPTGPFDPDMLPENFSAALYEDYTGSRTDNTFGKGRSMFEKNDETLEHLPADIALNASPSGDNGRPLSVLGQIQKYVTGFGVGSSFRQGNSLQLSTHDYWHDHEVWLHVSGNPYESTYDFKPVNQKLIQFRPLTDAVFASVELGLGVEHLVINKNQVGYLGSRAWQQQGYKRSPIQQGAYTRESIYAQDLFGPSQYVPQYNYMIRVNPNDPFSANYPEIDNYSIKRFYNKDYWGIRDWTIPHAESSFSRARPGFAVGVIGAICTATANNYITFTTTNYFGAPHYADVAIPSDRLPSFGGDVGANHDDLQTTCLSARIYQSWPREQTIYDPRFFAIHHFNPGTELSGVLAPWEEDYDLQERSGVNISYNGSDINVLTDVKMTDVDIRIPSIIEEDVVVPLTDSYLIFSEGATQSFSADPLPLLSQEHSKIDPTRRAKLLPYKYYKKSIGMHFPIYSQSASNVQIQPIIDGLQEAETMALSGLLSNSSLNNFDTQFFIRNGGVGYTTNDRFTVDAPNGEGVVLKPVINPSAGIVTGFVVDSGGFDFRAEDFADLNFEIKKISLGEGLFGNNLHEASALRIVLQTENVNAGNFEGYVLYGSITNLEFEDHKPKTALADGDILKISANTNTQGLIDGSQLGGAGQFGGNFNFGGGFANGGISFGGSVDGFADLSTEPGDLVHGINNTTVDLVDFSQVEEIHPLYKTSVYPKNTFDIFLHFQNDISHTWLEYIGNNGTIDFCRDQTINLEIFPF